MEFDSMPRLRLIMDPLISDKNMKLQRKCNRFCKILDKDLKSSKQKIEKEAENCVQSLYTLVLEAEEHETDRNNKITKDVKSSALGSANSQFFTNEPNQKPPIARPITAIGYGKRQTYVTTPDRPFSANPRILDNDPGGSHVRNDNKRRSSAIDYKEETRMNEIVPAWEKEKPGSLYKERRLYWNMPIYTDQKTEKKKHSNKLNQTSVSDVREASSVKPSRYVKRQTSPTHSHDNISDRDSSMSEHEFGHLSIKSRSKTVADYRRRHPDDELSQYWSRRVNRLIDKWDIEDKEQFDETSDDMKSNSDVQERLVQESPEIFQESGEVGNAKRRKQQFMQTYGKRYMFALKSDSSTSGVQNKYKRSVIVSRQELASIHADLAKKRKQTRQILRKSKRIVTNMAKLTEVKSHFPQ